MTAEVSRLLVLGPDVDSNQTVITKLRELCGDTEAEPVDNKSDVSVLNLRTKYYRAAVEVHGHQMHDNAPVEALAHEFHEYEALVCVVDASQRDSFLQMHRFAQKVVDIIPYDVCLLVAGSSSVKTAENVKQMESWCQENAFEFVDLDTKNPETSEDSVIDEKHGIERVLEALHCNMWRSMEMTPPSNSAKTTTTESPEAVEIEAVAKSEEGKQSDQGEEMEDKIPVDEELEATDDSRLQTLLQALEIAGTPGDNASGSEDGDNDIDMSEFSTLLSEETNKDKMAETSAAQNEVNLMDLPLEQLNSLKGQLEKELQQLTASFGGLREAQSRFTESKDALNSLAASNLDKQVLVPLTASMFVPGKLSNKEDVLVDVGTGYFVEQSVEKAGQFMDRKVEFLQSNTDQLKTVIESKRNMMEAVLMVMQQKMQEAQRG
ncbi:hypothetical protein BBO99_00007061 [Phytophthora kernoviae]|uniref:Uncharacterized protein n=1 Tax=Phytophthora kernoviae TaxID=325452 RepID=A0A3R7IEH8_9STRA|nr:hypothetical protein JM16_006288 [Phytophthora kernoviae]RLM96876.1 hypothetical protein BBI17_005236 [Phytophthora kernoviae]RLN77025.1 hypothetical protein BBO99_00007061 [Phytophthora kernoviae]